MVDNLEDSDETSKYKIDIFFDEIGYSRYHYMLMFVLILIFFADGSEILVISLILKSLEKEWHITPLEKSFIASSAFIGLMIGSFTTSQIIDRYGRKKLLLIGSGIVIIFGYLSSVSSNGIELFFFRLIMGIGIGTQIPAATNLAAESIPSYNRSIYLANMWIAFPIGEIYICIVAMYIMQNFEQDQWRVLLLYCIIPVVLCFIGSFFLYESSRYYLANNLSDQARNVLLGLSKWSGRNIDAARIDEIIDEGLRNPLNKYASTYSQLLNKRFLSLSINSWCIWFITYFSVYTTIYMLPQILAYNEQGKSVEKSSLFKDIVITNLIALPKTIIAGFMAEIKFLGRKYSMLSSLFFTAITTLFLTMLIEHINFFAGLMKLLIGVTIGVCKVYTTEAYPTKLRGLGYGTGHSFARLAGTLVPFIAEAMVHLFGLVSPFILVFFASGLGVYNAYSLPFETLGRKLDTVERDDLIELKERLDNGLCNLPTTNYGTL